MPQELLASLGGVSWQVGAVPVMANLSLWALPGLSYRHLDKPAPPWVSRLRTHPVRSGNASSLHPSPGTPCCSHSACMGVGGEAVITPLGPGHPRPNQKVSQGALLPTVWLLSLRKSEEEGPWF